MLVRSMSWSFGDLGQWTQSETVVRLAPLDPDCQARMLARLSKQHKASSSHVTHGQTRHLHPRLLRGDWCTIACMLCSLATQ